VPRLVSTSDALHALWSLVCVGFRVRSGWSVVGRQGFLGTEKAFNQNYSKPILASRNAKCSSREAEGGALALEALHRQVLMLGRQRRGRGGVGGAGPRVVGLSCFRFNLAVSSRGRLGGREARGWSVRIG
jgi:hypothetical protein